MAAYLIADVEITDPVVFQEYRKLAGAIVSQFGGKALVNGGRFETAAGDWHPKQIVVVEFPSMEQAKKWYDSEEYREAKRLRDLSSKVNLIFVEGL